MLVSELADHAGVPLATVKYYLREQLLPGGQMVGPRRAEYDESHLGRLRVLRLLREVGEVPVTSLRQVVEALDDDSLSVHEAMTVVADVISAVPEPDLQDPDSLATVDAVLGAVGWSHIRPESMDRQRLASLVTLLKGPGPLGASVEVLSFYAAIADQLARAEIALVDQTKDRAQQLEQMVTGSVLFGQVFGLLRQLGHEHHHAEVTHGGRLGEPAPASVS
jgi:DNA-binding transcriptional MerR regulator